jgi:hypothetical protein
MRLLLKIEIPHMSLILYSLDSIFHEEHESTRNMNFPRECSSSSLNLVFSITSLSLHPTLKTKARVHPHLTIVSIVQSSSRRSSTMSKCCTSNLLVRSYFDFLLQFSHPWQLKSIVHLMAQLSHLLHIVCITSMSTKSKGKYAHIHIQPTLPL